MNKEKKKELIKYFSELKVDLLKAYLENGKCCICEKKENCSIPIGKALIFLEKHPDVFIGELAELITIFEVALLSEDREDQVRTSVSAFPLEILEDEDQDEEREKEISNAIEGLRRRHQERIPCECKDPNCTTNLALEILRMAGDQWEKVLLPLSKIIENYTLVGVCILEALWEELKEPTVPGECNDD